MKKKDKIVVKIPKLKTLKAWCGYKIYYLEDMAIDYYEEMHTKNHLISFMNDGLKMIKRETCLSNNCYRDIRFKKIKSGNK